MTKVRKMMFGKSLLIIIIIIENRCLLGMTFGYGIARLPLDASLGVTEDHIFSMGWGDGAQGPEEEEFLMLDCSYLQDFYYYCPMCRFYYSVIYY